MRRFFITLMILLLPLRGWAGDLMGVHLAASAAESRMASTMPSDCPMLAAAVQASAEDDADDAARQMPSGIECCASCDLCTPLAELSSGRFDLVSFAARAKPLTEGVHFISASPAPALKPPIS